MTQGPLNASRAAAAYRNGSVGTAGPQQLLVMLYDRLLSDLERAHAALASYQPGTHVNEHAQHLVHAQEILLELRSTLRLGDWAGAEGLSALYTFLLTSLMDANVGAHPASRRMEIVRDCIDVITPLRDAWRQACAPSDAVTTTRDNRDGTALTTVRSA
jgi:flagellar secretion chaperone FliS